MTAWKTFRIRDVAQIFDGPHATPQKTAEGPLYLSISSLKAGRFDLAESAHLSDRDLPRWTKRAAPQPGDTLFSYETRIGEAAYWGRDVPAALGRRMGILRPDLTRVDPRFLTYAYLGPQFQGVLRDKTIYGTTVNRFPIGEMPSWPIVLPSLAYQAKIAQILGSIDDLIENLQRQAEVLEEMSRAVYREWFVNFHYPRHEDVPQIDSGAGWFPQGWNVTSTGALIRERILEIGDGYRAKNSELTGDEDGLPFVRVGNVRRGRLSLDGCDRLPLSYRSMLKSKVSRAGDVVLSSKGTVGRLAYLGPRDPEVAYSPQVSYWRSLKPHELPSAYLYLWVQSDSFVKQTSATKGSTAMADYVNLTDQRRMSLVIPPVNLLAEFSTRVEPLLSGTSNARGRAEMLAKLRDLLLPRLVTGQIDVLQLDLDAVLEGAVA